MGEFTWVRPICKEPKEKKKKDISIHGENLSTLISHSKKIFTTNKILKAAIGKIFHESFIFSGWLSSSFRWKFVPCLHTFIFWGHRIIAARDRKQLQVWFIYSHIFFVLFVFFYFEISQFEFGREIGFPWITEPVAWLLFAWEGSPEIQRLWLQNMIYSLKVKERINK